MTATMTRRPHTRTAAAAGLLLALAAASALALGVLPLGAAEAEQSIVVEPLTPRAEFTDDVAVQLRNKFDGRGTDVMNLRDASNIAVAKITIQPGAVIPWHTHPGPILITIAEGDGDGAFVYVLADDCVERSYTPGQALIDAGGDNVHTAYNPSKTDQTVVIATFLDAPAEGPLTLPVEGPDPDVCPLPSP